MIWWLTAAAALVIGTLLLCSYTRNPARRLMICAADIKAAVRQNRMRTVKKQMKRLLEIIDSSMEAKNAKLAYRAAETLKLTIIEGSAGRREARCLQEAVISALRRRALMVAVCELEAFQAFSRKKISNSEIIAMLGAVASIAYHNKQQLALAKSIDVAIECFSRDMSDREVKKSLSVLSFVGICVIKSKDCTVFADFAAKLLPLLKKRSAMYGTTELLAAWMHCAAVNEAEDLLPVIFDLNDELLTYMNCATICSLIGELKAEACSLALADHQKLVGDFSREMVDIAARLDDRKLWSLVAASLDNIAKTLIDNDKPVIAVYVFMPLLHYGDILLQAELHLSGTGKSDGWRQQVILILVRELDIMAAYWQRHYQFAGLGEAILAIRSCYDEQWTATPSCSNHFWELAVLYWYSRERSQAELNMPPEIDTNRLLDSELCQQLAFL